MAVPSERISRRKFRMSLFMRTRHEERKQETMPMTPVDDARSSHELPLALKGTNTLRPNDPWVPRCRVAAVTSGILLCAAVIIAVIVLAGVRA